MRDFFHLVVCCALRALRGAVEDGSEVAIKMIDLGALGAAGQRLCWFGVRGQG